MTRLSLFILFTLVATAQATCSSTQSQCGTACYSTSQYTCATDNNGATLLCPNSSPSACNKGCYNPSQYVCTATGLAPNTNSATQAAAASSSSTVSPVVTSSSTSRSTSAQTSSTTSSTKAQTPTSSSTVAKASTSSTVPPTSSTTSAAKTSSSSTVAPTTSSSPAAAPSTTSAAPTVSSCSCASGLSCCGSQCYNPNSYSCPTDSYTGSPVLCSVGSSACNGACYSPSAYSCSSNGKLVSGGQAQAGSSSTTPSTSTTSSSAAAGATNSSGVVVAPAPAPGNYPTQTADLRIINSCKTTLWFEARYGGNGAPIPGQSTTATQALPGSYVDYTVPSTGLSGSRFWAKYGCNSNGQNCLIGDQMQYWPNPPGGCPANGCTPPVDSLFEATWGCKPGASCNSQNPTTWFDTSQVDGWTIPYKLTANGATNQCDCNANGCGFNGVDATDLLLSKCPQNEDLSMGGQYSTAVVNGQTVSLSSVDLRIIDPNNEVVGCMSPCKRLNWGTPYGLAQSESSNSTLWMCCPTPTPSNCQVSQGCVTANECRAGPIVNTQYVNAVHTMAPGVYSYSYDDGVGLHACPAGTVTYTMEFCPGGATYPLQL